MSLRRQYPFHLIEPKWQQRWDEQQTFRAWNPGDAIPAEHPFARRHGLAGRATATQLPPKFYILDMFPYPSGAGLHVGHPEGYTATDILARHRRSRGFNVLHPMGWDAFGLPAEQYAIKTGQHPRATTEANIVNFKRQIQSLGFSYDWSREVNTTDPGYFRWTQWIFLQLYNSYFDPELNKAQPIALLQDALSENPKRESEWKKNAYLSGTRAGLFEDTTPDKRDFVRRAFFQRHRLAYVSEAPVNWCPELGTVLANEEVIDGRSEVGGFPVIRRPMRQWMLRITAYAKRLLDDLEGIDWSHSLKEMQRNWIGRSEGAEVKFRIPDSELDITVFTTRPDTLFGATYMVLSPEHKLVGTITTAPQQKAVEDYKGFAATKSDLERTELAKDKTGVFTGAFAINPASGEKIPIWIADYVLASYGTGAIMAVPAHDTRDFEFAAKFSLPVLQVVLPEDPKIDWRGFVEDGIAVNSSSSELSLDGLTTAVAKEKISAWLESKKVGKRTINYKLRDWLFSRQRYWGEPFPIVWRAGEHEGLADGALPLQPPDLDDFKPTSAGDPPLARAKDWVALSDGATRETNTMPQWAGSCWYYLRYLDARNPAAFCGSEAEHYWMGTSSCGEAAAANGNVPQAGGTHPQSVTPGVDLYVGGTEHAVLHLLYARFWHKVLFDLGHVSTPEPFYKLVNQGLILGELEFTAFSAEGGRLITANHVKNIAEEAGASGVRLVGIHQVGGEKCIGQRVPEEEVEKAGDGYVLKSNKSIRVDARSFKMSKSRGNVISPDVILVQYGADAFRLYEMFMGPLEMVKPWSTKGVDGVYRFLGRVWRLFVDDQSETDFEQATTTAASSSPALLELLRLKSDIQDAAPTPAQLKTLHACIQNVTEDLDGLRFNTAISELMMFVNEAMTWPTKPAAILRDFLVLLQPFAPHIAEELWSKLPSSQDAPPSSLAYAPWPVHDPALLVEETIEIPVQVNGKLRGVIRVAATATTQEIEAAAFECEKVKADLAGRTVKKVIVVPKKIVNIAAA